MQKVKDIAGRMTRSQDYTFPFQLVAIVRHHPCNASGIHYQVGYSLVKMNDSFSFQDTLPDRSNDSRQAIGTNMRMRIVEYIWFGSMRNKYVEYTSYITSFT